MDATTPGRDVAISYYMFEQNTEQNPLDKDLCGIANISRFRHGAMAATFDIFTVHEDARYAGQAAQAAFDELDHIENNLSKFIENSDISRINSLGPNCPLQLGPDAFDCLRKSIEMSKQTNGAFDVTFGSSHRASPDTLGLILNESEHTVELPTSGVQVDLGAIGKGYAADKMARLLGDWAIDTAMISAGLSTILPVGTPPDLPGWPLSLSDPVDFRHLLAKIHLAGFAVSASGLQKGAHIIDPRSGRPVEDKLAAWATAKTASAADALSTAFMVMSEDEIRTFCDEHTDTSALLILADDKILRFGNWNNTEFYC